MLPVSLLERQPHGEGQEVTQGQRSFVELLPQRSCDVVCQGGLLALDALEGGVQLGPCLVIVLG